MLHRALLWLKKSFRRVFPERVRPAAAPLPALWTPRAVAPDAAAPEAAPFQPLGGVKNIDAQQAIPSRLSAAERDLLGRVKQRIDERDFELPQLPSTAMAVMRMASHPSADLRKVAEAIGSDPVISTELLRAANSALHGGAVPITTLNQAVTRIGVRPLRSLILSLSMRGAVISCSVLKHYAEEIWRQSYSIACIARELGPFLRVDPERAFLIGLLHDIGKVSLLRMLSKEMRTLGDLASPLLGRLFLVYHEKAGIEMAGTWRLSDELVSVAGCHHDFTRNKDFPRSAAMANLAHKLDLFLSLGAELEYRRLAKGEEMEFLGPTQSARAEILTAVRRTFDQIHHPAAHEAA